MDHLVGLTEIATMLSVSRQRAGQLAETEGFPPPEAVISAGRIWRREDVVEWAVTSGRMVEYTAGSRRDGDHWHVWIDGVVARDQDEEPSQESIEAWLSETLDRPSETFRLRYDPYPQ